jgi:hypothetical protein
VPPARAERAGGVLELRRTRPGEPGAIDPPTDGQSQGGRGGAACRSPGARYAWLGSRSAAAAPQR